MLASLLHFNFSTDALILLSVVAVLVSGIMLGQHKVKTFALSVFVGIVLADQLGQPVFDLLKSRGLTFGDAIGIAKVRIGLLALPIIGLELGHNQSAKGRRRGMVLTMVLSIATAALVIATVIGLLEPEARQQILDGSTLASLFYGLRLWWLGAVPAIAIMESFVKPKER